MDKSKLILPITILLGCIILGGFYYTSQINKYQSIEKQQEIKLEAERKKEKERAENDRLDENFNNNLKCRNLLKDLKQRWNNVVGVYYSEWQNTCIVKYKNTRTGTTQELPIEKMEDE